MKVMTIVGTRPEIVKLSCILPELDRHTCHVLVHTGQNFDHELSGVFFDDLGLRPPDHALDVAMPSVAATIGRIITRVDEVLARERPEAVLLYGDTNSCLSVIPAKRRQIPVFHLEAGNRCFDERVPEEINRRLVDHLSDINLPLTEHARRHLLAEGIRPETVIKVGSTMKEVLGRHRPAIEASGVLDRLGVRGQGYLVASAHREETVDSDARLDAWVACLERVAREFARPVIVSTHPRTRSRLAARRHDLGRTDVRFAKPFGLFDYLKLQMHALCTISDSGTLTEEASILGFPAVTLREAHERPEGMDEGVLVMCGLDPEQLVDAIRLVSEPDDRAATPRRIVPDYDVDAVSRKVVRIILSYTGYVRRRTWYRP